MITLAAEPASDSSSPSEVQREIRHLEAECEHDRQIINQLELKVERLEGSGAEAGEKNEQLEVSNKKLERQNFQLR